MYKDMSDSRFKTIVNLASGGKYYLNLGDTSSSLLTKNLKKLGHVTTVDIRPGADIHTNLENGLKLKRKYDRIIAGEVLEHIYHLRPLLQDLKRALVNDGLLIVSVPNVCNLKSRIKVMLGRLPTYSADADEVDRNIGGHIRDLNVSYIKRILIEAGFKILKVKSGGLWFKNKLIIHPSLCKPEWGDNIIISASK